MTSTALQKPHITNLDPDAGKPADTVRVLGSHLGTARSALFKDDHNNEKSSPVTVISDTEVETSVPSGLRPGGGTVTVVTKGGGSNPLDFAILPG